MKRRQFMSYILGQTFTTACCATGCGTLMHPERRGQPHCGQIDWSIAALDGLGLILFFIPGVVAFAVDFYTGAIYLPLDYVFPGYDMSPKDPLTILPHKAGSQSAIISAPASTVPPVADQQRQPTWQRLGLTRVTIPREQLQPQRIEQVVTDHTGQEVSLDDGQARLSMLTRIDQFDEQVRRHRSDSKFGFSVRSFFSQLKRV